MLNGYNKSRSFVRSITNEIYLEHMQSLQKRHQGSSSPSNDDVGIGITFPYI